MIEYYSGSIGLVHVSRVVVVVRVTGGGTTSLNCGHSSCPRRYTSMESHGGIILTGENRRTGRKPDPVPL
jgi:hypothetical protein